MLGKDKKIIKTIRRTMPAVVSIILSKSLEALKKELPASNKNKATAFQIPPDKIDAHGMVQVGGGSGFIVDKSGIILTNKHVIAESGVSYTVFLNDDESYEAEVLARDPINDVAILKIKTGKTLPVVKLGNSENLELGQTVLAIGNALGIFKNTVSRGIVSGLSRSVQAKSDSRAPVQELRGLIQTDAAINPGNSGGPLVDICGCAVGINAAVVVGAQNISFAIPIKAAERDLSDLKRYGRIRRPLLGLRYLVLNHDLSEKMGLPAEYGAYITRQNSTETAVIPKSPADKAGILEQDIVLEWNGEKITSDTTLQDFLDDCKVGEEVKLKILRAGKEREVMVTLIERK
ncbi:MAG: trypsin-like peptidase domain-containing protein [Minisyncoccia bacterium]|jgi:serine protease Do